MLFRTLYVPTGQVFGSNTSAQNFEPIAKSRTILAQHIFDSKIASKDDEKVSHYQYRTVPYVQICFTERVHVLRFARQSMAQYIILSLRKKIKVLRNAFSSVFCSGFSVFRSKFFTVFFVPFFCQFF